MTSRKVLPLLGLLSSLLVSVPARAQPGPPVIPSASEAPAGQAAGSALELAMFGGLGGLAGNVGVELAYLPIPRLALGAALGDHYYDVAGSTRQELRYAFFARGYYLNRPRLRLLIGLAAGTVSDDHVQTGTDANGQPITVVRMLEDAVRVDGSLGIEAPLGNLALRLEAGLGRVFGTPQCMGVTAACQAAASSIPMPSPWRPFVQLALAVRPGGDTTSKAPTPADLEPAAVAPAKGFLQVALAGTPLRGTSLFNDGHYSDYPTFDAGIEADGLLCLGSGGWRIGLGARWGYGTGKSSSGSGGWEYESPLFVPVLFGWAGRSQETGEEVELLGGFGYGAVFFSFGSNGHGVMSASGLGGELALSYLRPLGPRTSLVLGISARLMIIDVGSAPADTYYLNNASGFHVEIPLRVGLRFKL